MIENVDREQRESVSFDVIVVGAGPAGLSAAIHLKLRAPHLSVVVLEKAAQVGDHILSGAVIDPSGLDALLPEWRKDPTCPMDTRVTDDEFRILTDHRSFRIPRFIMPPIMSNHGNYICSLGALCRWMAGRAEALGVEIYPGIAATELLIDDTGTVSGAATGDVGLGRDGQPTERYVRGMALNSKYLLIGEGARGSLAKELIARFCLDAGKSPQKFGLGLKEVWRVQSEKHRRGLVQHSMGWPLDHHTGGGSFAYHYGENLVALGFVVHLDYENPYLSPFEEFQRLKSHPAIRPLLEGGERLSYGARVITEGGWQSVPCLAFPGGALLGCSAGLVNLPRIKGVHNAMHSGILAADSVVEALEAGRERDVLAAYEAHWREGPIGRDLRPVRNVKPLWSRFGTFGGLILGGVDMWLSTLLGGRSLTGTLRHRKGDWETLKPAAQSRRITYPRPDGIVQFDRLNSVYFSGTNHSEDQPVHLQVHDMELQKTSELDVFDGPSTRYCPAAVYEWESSGTPRYVINAQNCLHCKTCDIKDPNQNIAWRPPQGGDGPLYPKM